MSILYDLPKVKTERCHSAMPVIEHASNARHDDNNRKSTSGKRHKSRPSLIKHFNNVFALHKLRTQCYINQLPVEILQLIFRHVCETEIGRRFVPIRIGRVCLYWSDIIQGMRFPDVIPKNEWFYDTYRQQWMMLRHSVSRLQGQYRYWMEDEYHIRGEALSC